MKKKLFLLPIIFLYSINVQCQWNYNKLKNNNGEFADPMQVFSYSKTHIWVKSDSLRHSSDNGKTFQNVGQVVSGFSPIFNDSTVLLYQFIPQYHNYFLHKSTNFGKTFYPYYIIEGTDTGFLYTSPDLHIPFNDKISLLMTSDSSNGCMEIWKTTDASKTWHRVPCKNITLDYTGGGAFTIGASVDGVTYQLNSISNNTIIKSRDYGNFWEEITPNIDNDGIKNITEILGIAFADSLHGLMSYYKSFQNSLGITEDGGKSWKTLKEKYTYQITYAKATANNPGFYFARYYNPTSKKYGAKVSFNNGYDWKILDTMDYKDFKFMNAEDGFCAVNKDSFDQIGIFKAFPPGFASNKDAVKPLKNEVKIYPNPAKEILNIESSQDAKYECINISGQIIMSGIAKANQTNTLPISGLASGLYFLKFTSDNSTEIKKIIVE